MFELTTNSFNVDSDGNIYVNEEKLDRDPPNPGKYRFQVNTNLYKCYTICSLVSCNHTKDFFNTIVINVVFR